MVQINDDYYEDLTPENLAQLLDDLARRAARRSRARSGRNVVRAGAAGSTP